MLYTKDVLLLNHLHNYFQFKRAHELLLVGIPSSLRDISFLTIYFIMPSNIFQFTCHSHFMNLLYLTSVILNCVDRGHFVNTSNLYLAIMCSFRRQETTCANGNYVIVIACAEKEKQLPVRSRTLIFEI